MLHALVLSKGLTALALAAELTVQAPGSNAAGYATPGEAVEPTAVGPGEVASPEVSPVVPPPVVSPGVMAPYVEPAEPGPTPMHLRPSPPRGDGRGLLIAAGVMGALNVGLAAARLGLSLGESTAEREQTRLILTAVVMPIDVVAGIGLAAAGGHFRGRRDGYRTAFDRTPKLRAATFSASGTVLLVMGAVAWASAWTPWHGDASLDARGGGSLMVESIGSLLLLGGSGLVAYGVSWKRHTERYGRSVPVSLQPAVSRGFAGLSLSGRF